MNSTTEETWVLDADIVASRREQYERIRAGDRIAAALVFASGDAGTEHLAGVPWHDARRPFWLHRCQPQTRGHLGFRLVERCACGGIRGTGDRYWSERNSRKRGLR